MGYDYDYYSSVDTDWIKEVWKVEWVKPLHPIFDPKQARDYLNQTKIWIDANRVEHRIKDMDESYLFNVLAWMRRRRDEIEFAVNFISYELEGEYQAYQSVPDSNLYEKILKQYKKVAGL